MSTVDLMQTTLSIWGAVFALIAGATVYLGRTGDTRRSDILACMLVTDAIMLAGDAIGMVYLGDTTDIGWVMTAVGNFLVFLCIPILVFGMAFYIYELARTRERTASKQWLYIIGGMTVVHALIIIVSPLTNLIYYFDANNVYHRTQNYILISSIAAMELVVLAAMTAHYRNRLTKYEQYSITAYLLLPFASNVVQAFHYGLILNNLAVTISLLLLFLTHEVQKSRRIVQQEKELLEHRIMVSEQQAQLAQKDAELTQNRMKISISQMRPHFAFNTLGSIEQLCRTDPAKAAMATHQFAQYLRLNLQTLSSTELIPFSKELEHVHNYVWLEKMRFGEDISYTESIEVSNLYLPPLTIQPMVENSIKHGMNGMEEGVIHVHLHTQELPEYFLITVEDDGCGFDPGLFEKSAAGHVGINNVRERLLLMQGGTVEIFSQPGQGTKVEVRIPKE